MDKIQKILNIQLPETEDINIRYLLPEPNSYNLNLEYIIKTHSSWFLERELLTQEINQRGRDIINNGRNIMFLGLNRSRYKKERWWKDYDFFWQNITGALLKTLKKLSTNEEYKKIFHYYRGTYITDLFKGYFFVNWNNISNAKEFIERIKSHPYQTQIKKSCEYLLKKEIQTLDINKIIVIGNDAYREFKNLFGINKEDISLSNFVLTNNFNLGKKNIEIYRTYHYSQANPDLHRKHIPKQLLTIS